MSDAEIVQGILDGCSLRTFMVPDPAVTYHPEHMESYDLPHVIINGNHFWGKSENGHLLHVPGEVQMDLNAFCYTNSVDFFCAHNRKENMVAVMRKDRYKTHEWRLIRNYNLIWDSDGGQTTDAVAEEIESCAKFRIAMLDREGIWNVHPVDLPMYEKESGRFQLKTVWDSYPTFFRHTRRLDNLIDKNQEFRRETAIPSPPPIFECFYSVFPDGTYYNFYDIPRNTKQTYERLKVFADSIPSRDAPGLSPAGERVGE